MFFPSAPTTKRNQLSLAPHVCIYFISEYPTAAFEQEVLCGAWKLEEREEFYGWSSLNLTMC
jgi:hypothetical protein